MSHHEEENLSEIKNRKKGGVLKAIYKLVTLGGLLIIVYRFFQKQKGKNNK